MANGDGTQAPEPPQSYTDPLAGLVSSGKPDFAVRGERDDSAAFDIATPVEPDPEMVRSMVDAALGGERGTAGGDDADPNATTGEVPVVQAPVPSQGQPPGVYPAPQRAWPARSQLLPQVLRRRQPARPEAGEQQPKAVREPWRPSKGSAGVIAALVLLLLFGIVAIEFVTSLIDSIAGLFD